MRIIGILNTWVLLGHGLSEIYRLVLPTAGEMIGEEEQVMNDTVAENVITEAIMGEVTN